MLLPPPRGSLTFLNRAVKEVSKVPHSFPSQPFYLSPVEINATWELLVVSGRVSALMTIDRPVSEPTVSEFEEYPTTPNMAGGWAAWRALCISHAKEEAICRETQLCVFWARRGPESFLAQGTVGTSVVPEPASFALIGVGLAGVAFMRRHRS